MLLLTLLPLGSLFPDQFESYWGQPPDIVRSEDSGLWFNELSDETPQKPFKIGRHYEQIGGLSCETEFIFLENKLVRVTRTCEGSKKKCTRLKKALFKKYGKPLKVKRTKKKGIKTYFLRSNEKLILSMGVGYSGEYKVIIFYSAFTSDKLKKLALARASKLREAQELRESEEISDKF